MSNATPPAENDIEAEELELAWASLYSLAHRLEIIVKHELITLGLESEQLGTSLAFPATRLLEENAHLRKQAAERLQCQANKARDSQECPKLLSDTERLLSHNAKMLVLFGRFNGFFEVQHSQMTQEEFTFYNKFLSKWGSDLGPFIKHGQLLRASAIEVHSRIAVLILPEAEFERNLHTLREACPPQVFSRQGDDLINRLNRQSRIRQSILKGEHDLLVGSSASSANSFQVRKDRVFKLKEHLEAQEIDQTRSLKTLRALIDSMKSLPLFRGVLIPDLLKANADCMLRHERVKMLIEKAEESFSVISKHLLRVQQASKNRNARAPPPTL